MDTYYSQAHHDYADSDIDSIRYDIAMDAHLEQDTRRLDFDDGAKPTLRVNEHFEVTEWSDELSNEVETSGE
ncbi:hypothetical protein ATN38_02005 [Rhodococcus sp. FH8]|uniref:hypothetical protein n=1 Tax=Rhodococcus sp. FH8 TaxID=1761013 RepID=UPI001C5010FF|nr:hypothetical protein [Rhodococcus sp. FH8]MBW0282435.1 hypothetical protein [Rhodococcus sp. FH8]